MNFIVKFFMLFYGLSAFSVSGFCTEMVSSSPWKIQGDFSNDDKSQQRYIGFQWKSEQNPKYFGVTYYTETGKFEGMACLGIIVPEITHLLSKKNVKQYLKETTDICYVMPLKEFKKLLKIFDKKSLMPLSILDILRKKINEIA